MSMVHEKRNNRRSVGVCIFLVGAINSLAWFSGNGDVFNVPDTINMKLASSVLFCLCGIHMCSRQPWLLRGVTETIILVVFSVLLGGFNLDRPYAVDSIRTGMPSLLALAAFICVPADMKITSIFIGIIASVALLGHLIRVPILYGFYEGRSAGMSIASAFLFLVISVVQYQEIVEQEHGE